MFCQFIKVYIVFIKNIDFFVVEGEIIMRDDIVRKIVEY